jgi:hypothetical protein
MPHIAVDSPAAVRRSITLMYKETPQRQQYLCPFKSFIAISRQRLDESAQPVEISPYAYKTNRPYLATPLMA